MTRGFTQLAVELIAVSMTREEPSILYGAVTMGDVWVFGELDRTSRTVTRDISSYQTYAESRRIYPVGES